MVAGSFVEAKTDFNFNTYSVIHLRRIRFQTSNGENKREVGFDVRKRKKTKLGSSHRDRHTFL